jgi:hypothetical protein
MLADEIAHELAYHLSGRPILRTTDFEKALPKPAIDSNAVPDILFHEPKCTQWIHTRIA